MFDKQKILKELTEFVAIESVSTDPGRQENILKAVEFLTNKLSSLGFVIKTFAKEKSPALIIATKTVSQSAKTIGIYGHYDVQPEDPMDEWQTEPFKLTLKNGKMWGRGIADDKGHVWQNITAIENLISKNELKNNIIFLLEGEEEVGSVHLESGLQKAREVLESCDVFYVIDCGMHGKNEPQIFYGLRGIVYCELAVTIGSRDLHSGIYGNSVYNPILLIAELFAKMKDSSTGRILIPHFYDKVRDIPESELALLRKTLRGKDEFKKEAGITKVAPSPGDKCLSSKVLPSFDPNGIIGGYTGPGAKTVIPRTASAKFSLRLVEDQDSDEVVSMVKTFIETHLPEGVEHTLTISSKDAPFYMSVDNEYVQKTARFLKDIFGHEVLFNRSGGSIPVTEKLQRLFNKPLVLTGFTLPDENLHSPNENFDEEMFWKGIEALEKVYSSL